MKERDEVREMWILCFDDSEEFLDLYFSRRYSDEVNMCVRERGRMTASLQMIPYDMTLCGKSVGMSYISGACTHPDYRGRGVMRRLLDDTHRRMYADGVAMATLIPANERLFGYYAKAGYAPTFRYVAEKVCAEECMRTSECVVTDERGGVTEELYGAFDMMMRRRECSVQHTIEDLQTVLADMEMSGGKMLAARRQGVCGVAFVGSEGVVKELLAEDEEVRLALIYAVSEMTGERCVSVERGAEEGRCRGMARITDVERVLSIYAERYEDKKLCVKVEDSAIDENCGCFRVSGGRCERCEESGEVWVMCSVAELTAMVMQDEVAVMSLMME